MHTLYTLIKYQINKATVFTKNPQYVPKDDQKGGIEDILSKYKK